MRVSCEIEIDAVLREENLIVVFRNIRLRIILMGAMPSGTTVKIVYSPKNDWSSTHIEEGFTHIREGKSRRCCVGDKVDVIPCRAGYFVPGY